MSHWIESSVTVDNVPVGLSVHLLSDEDKDRTAAVFAWLTLDAVRIGTPAATEAWHAFLGEVMREHVAFTVSDVSVDELAPSWWGEAIQRALRQFLRQNDLAPSINYHIERLRGIDGSLLQA
jgi:hypothetical protein